MKNQMRSSFHLKPSVIFVLDRKKIVQILRYPSSERSCSWSVLSQTNLRAAGLQRLPMKVRYSGLASEYFTQAWAARLAHREWGKVFQQDWWHWVNDAWAHWDEVATLCFHLEKAHFAHDLYSSLLREKWVVFSWKWTSPCCLHPVIGKNITAVACIKTALNVVYRSLHFCKCIKIYLKINISLSKKPLTNNSGIIGLEGPWL